ncbi:MAG: DUF2760 domain-containing protein [Sumerlaeia bacterium]
MHPILALKAFFRVLAKGEPQQLTPPPETAFQGSREPAVQLLALLQKEGRLVDFLMENLEGFTDAEIGGAVRPIHGATKKLFQDRIKLVRIQDENEGTTISVPAGYDASRICITGNVSNEPPFSGIVRHKGWAVLELNLPTVPAGADPLVVAPAEVDVR